jgi:SPX domain protein involved in polyphosphate accumulation
LKRELKDRTLSRNWTEQDEREFTALLEKELDKIHDFQQAKVRPSRDLLDSASHTWATFAQTSELSRRIRDAERDVKRLVSEEHDDDSREHEHGHDHDAEGQPNGHHDPNLTQDAGSDDEDGDDSDEDASGVLESVDSLEDRFHALEEEVATLVADVHDLALYTKLNITGFMKILKVCSRSSLCLLSAYLSPPLET